MVLYENKDVRTADGNLHGSKCVQVRYLLGFTRFFIHAARGAKRLLLANLEIGL